MNKLKRLVLPVLLGILVISGCQNEPIAEPNDTNDGNGGNGSSDNSGSVESSELIGTWEMTDYVTTSVVTYTIDQGGITQDYESETVSTYVDSDYNLVFTDDNQFTAGGVIELDVSSFLNGDLINQEVITTEQVSDSGSWSLNGNILMVDGENGQDDLELQNFDGQSFTYVTSGNLEDLQNSSGFVNSDVAETLPDGSELSYNIEASFSKVE